MAMFDMDYEKLYHASMMMDPTEFERGLDQWMMASLQGQQQMQGGGQDAMAPEPVQGFTPPQGASGAPLMPQALNTLAGARPGPVQPHFAPPVAPHGGNANIQFTGVAPAVAPGGQAGPRRSMADIMYGRR